MTRLATLSMLLIAPLAAQTPAPKREITLEWRVAPDTADLSNIGRLLVAKDGRVVVTQEQDNQFRIYSQTRPMIKAGRKGAGPGEFQQMVLGGWMGDTIWIGDVSLRRVSFFTLTGTFVRSTPFLNTIRQPDGKIPPINYAMITPQGFYPDGTSLMAPFPGKGPDPFWIVPGHEKDSPLVRVTRDSIFRNVAAWRIASSGCSVSKVSEKGSIGMQIPFCATPLFGFNSDASLFVSALVPESKPGSYQVSVTKADGSQVFARTFSYSPTPIPSRVIDSARTINIEHARDPRIPDMVRSMKFPANYPPLREVIMGRDGTVWLREFTRTAERQWLALSVTGMAMFRLSLPSNLVIAQATADHIWCIETNSDGEEGIAVYRIKP